MPKVRLTRSNGTLIWDAGIPPFALTEKGTVTTISTTGSDPHWSTNSPSSFLIPMNYDSDEMIAVYMPTYAYARYANLQYNGVWYHIFHCMAPVGTSVTYYRFRMGIDIQADLGPGCKAYTSTGVRTFHSAMKIADIKGRLSNLNSVINLPAGRNYATVVQTTAGHLRGTFDGSKGEIVNDKGQVTARYWNGVSDGKLYGVKWNSANQAMHDIVWFNDVALEYFTTQYPTQPPDFETYHNEIINTLFLDVTGF